MKLDVKNQSDRYIIRKKRRIIGIGLIAFSILITHVWSETKPRTGSPSVPPDYPAQRPIPPALKIEKIQIPANAQSEIIKDQTGFKAGIVVYANEIAIKGYPEYQKIIGLQATSSDSSSSVTYRVTTPSGVVFDPQFSPNGQHLLFKVGWPYDSHGKYSLYLFDLSTKKIQAGPPLKDPLTKEFLSYRQTSWSPNGAYIAYIRGGDADGHEYSTKYPLKLYVYEVSSGKSYFIAQNRALKDFVWSSHNTLLFTLESQQGKKASKPIDNRVQNEKKAESIYEANATGGEATLVIDSGHNPLPSPNGRWIMYYSEVGQGEKASLYDVAHKVHRDLLIKPANFIKWLPDSRKLVSIRMVQNSPHSKAQINMIDVDSLAEKPITILDANDFELIHRAPTEPQIQPLTIPGQEILFVAVSEMTGIDQTFNMYNQLTSIKSIDLSSGEILTIARIKTPLGVDFFSTPK